MCCPISAKHLSKSSVQMLSKYRTSEVHGAYFPRKKMHRKNTLRNRQNYIESACNSLIWVPELWFHWGKCLCNSFWLEDNQKLACILRAFCLVIFVICQKAIQAKSTNTVHLLLHLESTVFQQQSLASIPGEAFILSIFPSPSKTY